MSLVVHKTHLQRYKPCRGNGGDPAILCFQQNAVAFSLVPVKNVFQFYKIWITLMDHQTDATVIFEA